MPLVSSNRSRQSRIWLGHDPQIEIRRVSPVFAKKERQGWKEAEPGHILNPRGGAEARAGSTILQEEVKNSAFLNQFLSWISTNPQRAKPWLSGLLTQNFTNS